MSALKGQTVYFTTKFDPAERSGIVEEATSMGYKINGSWYGHGDVTIRNVLLDSKTTSGSNQLIFG